MTIYSVLYTASAEYSIGLFMNESYEPAGREACSPHKSNNTRGKISISTELK